MRASAAWRAPCAFACAFAAGVFAAGVFGAGVFGAVALAALAASAASAQAPPDAETGERLFLVYCAECHGENGDGWGMRRDISYARPRSFLSGRFKLATTENRVPSDQDLYRTIANGMPGSGMPNWVQLPENEIRSLVLFVRELGVDALRAELDADVAAGRRTQEQADAILEARTVPGPPVEVPPEPAADTASIDRGRELYGEACAACHGVNGSPPYGAVHVDFDGNRLPATSLRAGQFKGGPEGEQLYVRIAKGMDGTAMPGYQDAYSPTDLWHLVHWVEWLADHGDELPAPTETAATSPRAPPPAADATSAQEVADEPARRLDRWLLVVATLAGLGLLGLLFVLAIGSR